MGAGGWGWVVELPQWAKQKSIQIPMIENLLIFF
jgi:hypothetical protein